MANMTELLGVLMQTSMPPSGGQRMGNALEQLRQGLGTGAAGGAGGGGLLGGLLEAAAKGMAGAGPDAAGRPGGGADGLAALAGALLGGRAPGGPAPGGSPAGGGQGLGGLAALAGALLGGSGQTGAGAGTGTGQGGGLAGLAGALLGGGPGGGQGRGRAAAGGAGALALIATIAMQALKSVQGAAPAAGPAPAGVTGAGFGTDLPVALRGAEDPAAASALETSAELVLRGMLNAAKADGRISPEEMQRVVGKLGGAGADAAMQQWVMAQLAAPLDLSALAREIPNQQVAAEVYAASLLAIEVDTDAERRYLAEFASATGLHPLVVRQIHANLGLPAPA